MQRGDGPSALQLSRPDRRVFEMQLSGYCLTTAEILYRIPDHPSLLQSYIWQEYDLPPQFPQLQRFLEFWRENLDGALHSVKMSHASRLRRASIRTVSAVYPLH